MFKINSLDGNQRMSTQDLLQVINEAVATGEAEFHIEASGQHDIGGPLWHPLMKHDPLYAPPEFWVLKNCGSFSFEFMSGGIAVICGYDSDKFESVLGDRSCVGMVGGTLYFRGNASGISKKDVKIKPLGEEDVVYLSSKMDDFLTSIAREEIKNELTNWAEWYKVVPLKYDERAKTAQTKILPFRTEEWVANGIFSDVLQDDFSVIGLVTTDLYRQRVPVWENAYYASPCEFNCTASIPSQHRYNLLREGKVEEAYKLVLEYTPFPGSVCGAVCPNVCMEDCTRKNLDISVQIGELGTYSKNVTLTKTAASQGKKVAVVGGGAAGLTVAWQLVRKGYDITVFEADKKMGGKLEQVIPRSRLPQQTLAAELKRIEDMGVVFKPNTPVDKEKFAQIRADYDAVVVATGGHKGRVIPWPGHERIVKGIDFLKGINKGESPKVGKHVIVIGCGNSGMDAAVGAYQMGAEQVICIDVGATLMWPVITKEVTAQGIITQNDEFIKGDTIIIAIGEVPELDFLPEEIVIEKGHLKVREDYRIAEGVYTAGDAVKPGRMVDAIGAAQQAASAVEAYLTGTTYQAEQKTKIDKNRLSTAYFKKCHSCEVPQADEDHLRCISCGTCRDCHMCERSCPQNAITRILGADGNFQYISDSHKCIGCGICAGICPCGISSMHDNKQPIHA